MLVAFAYNHYLHIKIDFFKTHRPISEQQLYISLYNVFYKINIHNLPCKMDLRRMPSKLARGVIFLYAVILAL